MVVDPRRAFGSTRSEAGFTSLCSTFGPSGLRRIACVRYNETRNEPSPS
jgi:hypothetical protein